MNATQAAPETGLSTTQNAEPSSAVLGCCTCRPRVCFDDCVCEWGTMIRVLMYLGYNAVPEQIIAQLPDIMQRSTKVMSSARRRLLQSFASQWPGTVKSFLEYFKLTRPAYDRCGIKISKI